jgi:transposase-like protein
MDWPIQPLEVQRRFTPRFCPRRGCAAHNPREIKGLRFKPVGGYFRADRRRVQRFRCPVCGKTFSKQAFAFSYYLKRPELTVPIAAGLNAGSAHRQLARSIGCAPSTVTRRAARLGRHAILLLARAVGSLESLDEPIVLDHFETFEFTQDLPFGVATPIGRRSEFVYGLDPCPHPRTGTRSPAQAARLKTRPKRPARGGYAGSFARCLDGLLQIPRLSGRLSLVTDGHPEYRRLVTDNRYRERVRHAGFPNPKRGPKGAARSREAIVRDRAMGPVDHLHRLIRHSLAHHRRETLAFGRRLNALMERLFLAAIWKNFAKGLSERDPRSPSPAMTVGLTRSRWSWSRVFARRLFPDLESPAEVWLELYRRDWLTPALPANTRHRLIHAF